MSLLKDTERQEDEKQDVSGECENTENRTEETDTDCTADEYFDAGLHYAGVEKNFEIAVRYFAVAAKMGHCKAQYMLGVAYEQGIGVEKDLLTAMKCYSLAADQKHEESIAAFIRLRDAGVGPSRQQSNPLYDFAYKVIPHWAVRVKKGDLPVHALFNEDWINSVAVDSGIDLRGEFHVGSVSPHTKKEGILMLIYIFPEPQNPPEAKFALLVFDTHDDYVRYFTLEKSENILNPEKEAWVLGAIDMTQMIEKGEWKHVNYGFTDYEPEAGNFIADAVSMVRRENKKINGIFAATEQNSEEEYTAEDYYTVGVQYANGDGVEQDNKRAVHFFTVAAGKGYATAQATLAFFYEEGLGAEQNLELAAHYYSLAAAQGNAEGQFGLGNLLIDGRGVEKDEKRGAELLRLAAEQGSEIAQNDLGWCYEKGVGVEQNRELAIEWATKAAAQGNEKSIERLKRLNAPPAVPETDEQQYEHDEGKYDGEL